MRKVLPQCWFCKHFTSDMRERHKNKKDTCTAFPDGIPSEIWNNYHDHREPHLQDNGVQFESLDFEGEDLKRRAAFKDAKEKGIGVIERSWEHTEIVLDLNASLYDSHDN